MHNWIPGLVGAVAAATVIYALWMLNRQSHKHVSRSVKNRRANVHDTERIAIISPKSITRVGHRDGFES